MRPGESLGVRLGPRPGGKPWGSLAVPGGQGAALEEKTLGELQSGGGEEEA